MWLLPIRGYGPLDYSFIHLFDYLIILIEHAVTVINKTKSSVIELIVLLGQMDTYERVSGCNKSRAL